MTKWNLIYRTLKHLARSCWNMTHWTLTHWTLTHWMLRFWTLSHWTLTMTNWTMTNSLKLNLFYDQFKSCLWPMNSDILDSDTLILWTLTRFIFTHFTHFIFTQSVFKSWVKFITINWSHTVNELWFLILLQSGPKTNWNLTHYPPEYIA